MAIWRQPGERLHNKLRYWQRTGQVLARKAAHKGHIPNILRWNGWTGLLILLVTALGLLASSAFRQWLSTAFATFAIFGGIIAAPVISLVGWIGVTLPVRTPLHQAAPTLFIGALLWMTMAIVSAHARREETADN